MTNQNELIDALIRNLEVATIIQKESPSLINAQALANARHNLHKFIKENASK